MNQKPEPVLPLFDQPQARKTDPPTSKAAARRVKANSVRGRILNAMERLESGFMKPSLLYPGAATFEIAQYMGVGRDSVSPHMKPLKVMGYVKESQALVQNPLTKNQCVAWRLTEKYFDSGLRKADQPRPQTCCPMCGKTL